MTAELIARTRPTLVRAKKAVKLVERLSQSRLFIASASLLVGALAVLVIARPRRRKRLLDRFA